LFQVLTVLAEILAFPGGYSPRDPRGMAIEFAARCAQGDYGNIKTAILLFDTPDGLGMLQAGEETDGYRTIGLLEAAKMAVFADGETEE
jgi:hypothetical protein